MSKIKGPTRTRTISYRCVLCHEIYDSDSYQVSVENGTPDEVLTLIRCSDCMMRGLQPMKTSKPQKEKH